MKISYFLIYYQYHQKYKNISHIEEVLQHLLADILFGDSNATVRAIR